MGERDGGEIVVEDSTLAAGFVQVPHRVFFDPNLRDGPVRVYGALLWWWWTDRRAPGQVDMAKQLGMSLRTVQRHLAELEEHGYMRVQQIGLGRANRYTITAVACQDTPDLACLEPPTVAGPVRQSRRVQDAKSDAHTYRLDSTSLDSTTPHSLAQALLAALHDARPTRQRRERAVAVITDLLQQGLSAEDIAAGIDLLPPDARGPELLPHTIGQAIGRRAHVQEVAASHEELAQQVVQEATPDAQRLAALSPAERRRVEALARQGLPANAGPALVGCMLPGLMIGLLEEAD